MSSIFSKVKLIEENQDINYSTNIDDKDARTINLTKQGYVDIEGKPWVLPSVRRAEDEIHAQAYVIPDYSFPNSLLFTVYASKLLLGEDSPAVKENRVASTQTVSGTGALRIGADFLTSLLGRTIYYYSDPTWDSHLVIFKSAGFKEARPYRYWCPKKHDIDFTGLLQDLQNAPEGAVILLHASVHSPTGLDLSKDQWKQIAVVMKERRLFPFFDCSFQGLAKGLDEDAWSVRYFVEQGFELFCVQSFSKNMGLYCERIANLVVVTHSTRAKYIVDGLAGKLIRGMFLTPTLAHGNRICSRLWTKPEYKSQWIEEMAIIRNRLAEVRTQLRAALERLGTPGDWSFITRQVGIASLIGLNEAQVDHLAKRHHVYIRSNGRANISSIPQSKIEYVANAINETVTSVPN